MLSPNFILRFSMKLVSATLLATVAAPRLRGSNNQCSQSLDQLPRCSCLEILQLTNFNLEISDKDVKGGYKRAALLFHPDTGGSAFAFTTLTDCMSILSHAEDSMTYRLEAMHIQLQSQNDHEAMRNGFQGLFHRYTTKKHGRSSSTEQQHSRNTETKVERLHVFLDNSHSMSWDGKLQEAHAVFAELEDRFSRNSCSVHFIGNRGSRFLFMELTPPGSKLFSDGDVNIPDVLNAWSADGGRTYLWEYMFNVLRAGSNEVMIITDGCDNDSEGKFEGRTGFNAMMLGLKELGINLRINILSLGSDVCEGTAYTDLAHATGGIYVHAIDQEEATPFTEHMLSSHATRETLALAFQEQYQDRLAGGHALALPWFGGLSKWQGESKPTKTKSKTSRLDSRFKTYTVNQEKVCIAGEGSC